MGSEARQLLGGGYDIALEDVRQVVERLRIELREMTQNSATEVEARWNIFIVLTDYSNSRVVEPDVIAFRRIYQTFDLAIPNSRLSWFCLTISSEHRRHG